MKIINTTRSNFVKVGDLKPGDVFIYRADPYIVMDRENSRSLSDFPWLTDFIMVMNFADNRFTGLAKYVEVKRCDAYITLCEE
jgi:hypothetical protein